VFLALTLTTGSCCVAVAAYARLRRRLPALLAFPVSLAALVLAPVALALLAYRPLAARVPGKAVAGTLAALAGAGLYLVPLLLALGLGGQPDLFAVMTVLLGTALIGLFHGLLITKLKLQPFIVTLCGLFVWRGLALWLALPDQLAPLRGLARFLTLGRAYAGVAIDPGSATTVGIGDKSEELSGLIRLSIGYPHLAFLDGIPGLGWINLVPLRLWLLLLVAGLFALLLHASVYGRYLFAVGANEQAARYAGIPADRYKVLAYVLCSLMAGLAGILQFLELQTASPSGAGQFYELYAITGAVLGGCSLRGGEGTVLGMLLGAAVLPLLRNLQNFSNLPDDLEFLVIGFALLLGTIIDELLKRRAARSG
jgi:ribose transport system permease protein